MTRDTKALVVGISGCSSSGKTTLALLLRHVFPDALIVHEDDFYKPEAQLPSKHGLLDWDCPEAIDAPVMVAALTYAKPSLDFPRGPQHSRRLPRPRAQGPRLCLVDGFLLYPPSMAALQPSPDVKLFVRASHAAATARRGARGYVTLEGFWQDPPGYVDAIVWPNYVAQHAWMFERGDVEGPFRLDVLRREGIRVLEGAPPDADMEQTLGWMVDTILDELRERVDT